MRVFLSYAAEDRKWAQELISSLQDAGLQVWDGAAELANGNNWFLETGKALEGANAMVVLLSPAAAKSEGLKREIDYALTSKRFKHRLIPVIVKPTAKIPWILQRLRPETGDPSSVSKRIVRRLKGQREAA